jgi:DNA-binding transcriptional regulator/RsmH inhibitor MraZ
VIIGVNERLEIWSLEEFNKYMKENEESLETITEDIFDSPYEA